MRPDIAIAIDGSSANARWPSIANPIALGSMTIGDRIRERLHELGISQSELARRVSITQGTVAGLIRGKARSSTHLHKIARELQTTAAYLEGETDDPDEHAPPPRPQPVIQYITMQVALPSENALSDMFEAQLRAFGRLEGAELARALAKRLPRALARLQAVDLYETSGDAPDDRATPEPPVPDRHERQQVRRK